MSAAAPTGDWGNLMACGPIRSAQLIKGRGTDLVYIPGYRIYPVGEGSLIVAFAPVPVGLVIDSLAHHGDIL